LIDPCILDQRTEGDAVKDLAQHADLDESYFHFLHYIADPVRICFGPIQGAFRAPIDAISPQNTIRPGEFGLKACRLGKGVARPFRRA
jgi:hypothetical protein